ncbi:MAG: tRNA (guanosine(37)-N1)-methyltransferase TrmD [Chloroflexi bacterium]|nr:tRNA (guanosine(37)-N1)-methyltransferase TrmD [Chloroflexota bacterium]|tara:strand:+ start:30555 stop:31250 length:696 start_codon:yes stop_codon:yes gene_type:complete
MILSVITLFPKMFDSVFNHSIISRAVKSKKVNINIYDLADFAQSTNSSRKILDSSPYGGGPGMVLRPEPLYNAVKKIKENNLPNESKVILLSPQGKTYNFTKAKNLSNEKSVILVCGHYEGVDQRFIDLCVDEELSIGDYILTGGEIPAMVVIDSVTRLLLGVLGNDNSNKNDSFSEGNFYLKGPVYTRPREFLGNAVPKILLNGNHKEINKWRTEESQKKTKDNRPDLLN